VGGGPKPSSAATPFEARGSEVPAGPVSPTVVGTHGAFGAPLGKREGEASSASPPETAAGLFLGADSGTEEVG